jgi:hypothetical protein
VYIAFQDYVYAKSFERRINEALSSGSFKKGQTANPLDCTERFPWTRIHGHYALMGGFAFETRRLSSNIFPRDRKSGDRTRLTLTPHALEIIADYDPDLIPDVSKAEIQDKSKADGLAKTIVCIQALWYVISTFIGLPNWSIYRHSLDVRSVRHLTT